MERLGSHVHDHKAQAISSIPLEALIKLNAVRPHRLYPLILTFANAAEKTKEGDFFFDNEDPWAWFLINVFQLSSDAQTKTLSLQTLVKVMIRFDTERVRLRVYHLIRQLDDPTDIQQLAEAFREHQRDDLAQLLDGVPHDRDLDEDTLRDILSKPPNDQPPA